MGYIARNGVLETAELTWSPFDEYGNVVDIFPDNTVRAIGQGIRQLTLSAEAAS